MDEKNAETYGPESFKFYIEKHSLPRSRTWQYVSIDSIDRLPQDLRDAGIMIFRLGSRSGISGTHFALARCNNGWEDYFLDDSQLIASVPQKIFLPYTSSRRLLAFQLLPKLTETSLVNLAIGSGLLQYALGINDCHENVVPATGQSTYSFEITPKPCLSEPWQHIKGQVEIDALFMAHREGKDCLFLVEAKSGKPTGTLAKHKLCYPLAALRSEVPNYINIVPVYLKTWPEADGQHFLISECCCNTSGTIVISDFNVSTVHEVVLQGFVT